jgi:hypothetical protein
VPGSDSIRHPLTRTLLVLVADLRTTVLTLTSTGLAGGLLTLATWLVFMPAAITSADR